jgi:hypothetical protein
MGSQQQSSYETDFYAWSNEQAALLRGGRFSQLDIAHLAEEIEDLGKRERRALQSRLGVLLGHLLKWRHQGDYPYRKSWRATINAQRRSIGKLLDDNPSLRSCLVEAVSDAYLDARDLAVAETPLDYDAFPTSCPWTLQQILDDYWPATL